MNRFMDRKQTADLLQTIQDSYPSKFHITEPVRLLNAWEQALKNHDFNKVMANFYRHLELNAFPPTIADLVKSRHLDRMNAVPDAKETKEYLDSLSKPVELTDVQLQSIEQSKAEIRRILGIG
jgi:hypothetical protein